MGNKIDFPGANEEQNEILNMIAEQQSKKLKAEQDAFDAEKDKDEFLFLWKHFYHRLNKFLEDFRDVQYNKGTHSLIVTLRIKKEDSTDEIREEFVYNDKLKMFKITEIE